jgi:acetoin utilization protein AcuC
MPTSNNLHIAYSPIYLKWKLGYPNEEHPTNPVRAKYATELLAADYKTKLVLPKVVDGDRARIESIHSKEYVSRVLDKGHCGEWKPDNTELGNVALHMFAGTVRLVEKMLAGEARVCFNPQGAKHHAQYDRSSGFCVFNDMAWAAKEFHKHGMKVVYIDWDAHHGDGVEALLYDEPDIITCSIHDGSIFPGTGVDGHDPKNGVYNWAVEPGAGDATFIQAMREVDDVVSQEKPDVILVATGADGHITDPLSSLNFDYPGYAFAAETVGRLAATYADNRVLIGGAGGYQPFDHTPAIWAHVVSGIYESSSAWLASGATS